MTQRNSSFGDNPHHDLCTEVAMTERGLLPITRLEKTGQPDDFEEVDLYAEGDRNIDVWDQTYVHGDTHNSGMTFEDNEDRVQNYLLEQLAEEQAIEAAAVREEQLSAMYDKSERVPFFQYQHHRGTAKPVAQTRSEVYEVAGSLGGRMRHVNTGKHQQFFDGVRIH